MKHSKIFLLLLLLNSSPIIIIIQARNISEHSEGHSTSDGTQPGDKKYQLEETQEVTTMAPRTAIIAELVSLSAVKSFFAILTFPLLIPIILLAFGLLIPLLPLLSAPLAFGRRLGEGNEVDDILAEILQSSYCMERFSCEIGRSIKSPQVRSIIDQSFADLSGQLEGKWKNSYYGYVIGSNYKSSPGNICVKFKCKVSKNPLR